MTPRYALVCLCIFALICAHAMGDGEEAQTLVKMRCATLTVDPIPPTLKEVVPPEDDVKDTLLVEFKAKLPRLKLNASCENRIMLQMSGAKHPSGGRIGIIYLVVKRPATLRASGVEWELIVWSRESLFLGSSTEIPGFRDSVEQMVTQFAADYYKAGNP